MEFYIGALGLYLQKVHILIAGEKWVQGRIREKFSPHFVKLFWSLCVVGSQILMIKCSLLWWVAGLLFVKTKRQDSQL